MYPPLSMYMVADRAGEDTIEYACQNHRISYDHSMNKIAPEVSQQAVDVLQTNYSTYNDPYSIRGVMPLITEVCDSSEALEDFITPLTTTNTLVAWLHLPEELKDTARRSLPVESDNPYYQNLFEHVVRGEVLSPDHQWLSRPHTIPTWEDYYADDRQGIAAAERETHENFLVAGPHGNHRQLEYDMVTAGIWMVCRRNSSRNWPIATHPERTDDALHFLRHIPREKGYARAALSIAGALNRLEDEVHWQQVRDAGLDFLTKDGEHDNFRRLLQSAQLKFAMQRGDFAQAVTTEAETLELRNDSLPAWSLSALCTVIKASHEK